MKKFVVLALTLLAGRLAAQNFEGTITWAIKTEITDPQMKAKFDEGQAKMNDPATQAKMKELQTKMNDPQMKAMMESNPQMKAQMENMMKMAQGGNMNSMMPTGFTVQLKGNNSLTKMDGGMMPMEILNLKDKNLSYRLDRNNKTYSVLAHAADGNNPAPQFKVTKTTETARILNYNCTKYIVDATMNGKPVQHFFWTTTEIKDIDMSHLAKQRMGKNGQSMYYEGIEGVPLKMEMQTPEARMIMEVTAIKKEPLPDNLFILPADFKEIKGLGM